MFASSLLAASIICTSQVSTSADPHSSETVNRIEINLESSKAELKTYDFESWELWGTKNIDELLTDDRLVAPAKSLEVEEVTNFDRNNTSTTYELYSTKNWQWTLDSLLTLSGNVGTRSVKFGDHTYVEKMNCKQVK